MIFRVAFLLPLLLFPFALFSQNTNNALYFLITRDSVEFIGNIESENEFEINLRLRSRELITVNRGVILILEPVTEDNFMRGKYVRPNRFANRYIGTRSAIGLRRNECEIGTHYGMWYTFDYGLTDEYSVGFHSSVLLAPVMVNLQANYKVGTQLYVGLTGTGGWMSWIDKETYFGFGGAKLTTGSRNNNYTFGGGYFSVQLQNLNLPSLTGPSHFSLGEFGYFNVSATRRYMKNFYGLAEIWAMKNLYLRRSVMIFNLGMRINRKQHAAWTFYLATLTFQEIRSGEIRVVPIPSLSWVRRLERTTPANTGNSGPVGYR